MAISPDSGHPVCHAPGSSFHDGRYIPHGTTQGHSVPVYSIPTRGKLARQSDLSRALLDIGEDVVRRERELQYMVAIHLVTYAVDKVSHLLFPAPVPVESVLLSTGLT